MFHNIKEKLARSTVTFHKSEDKIPFLTTQCYEKLKTKSEQVKEFKSEIKNVQTDNRGHKNSCKSTKTLKH